MTTDIPVNRRLQCYFVSIFNTAAARAISSPSVVILASAKASVFPRLWAPSDLEPLPELDTADKVDRVLHRSGAVCQLSSARNRCRFQSSLKRDAKHPFNPDFKILSM